jgi:hypothetical protein
VQVVAAVVAVALAGRPRAEAVEGSPPDDGAAPRTRPTNAGEEDA